MQRSFFLPAFLGFIAVCLYACLSSSQGAKHPSQIDFSKVPYPQLSDYGFFVGEIKSLKPHPQVVYYEPIAQLFTDYAFKKRYMWMPEGSTATFDSEQSDAPLNFPDKTILIKHFYYPQDFAKPEGERKIMETRLLVKLDGKWNAFPYHWNEAQTEAVYKVTGGVAPVSWKDEKQENHAIQYAFPNKNQCKSCHNQNDKFVPIGPKVKQLNHSIRYEDGTTENQLAHLVKVGYLTSTDGADKIPTLVGMNDPHASIEDKARAYLDVNCGHCHNKNGPASTSGLNLHIEEKNPFYWGVNKAPVAAGIGAGSFKFDINPGKGKESILTYRMNSTHPGIMMPEVGRVSIHKEGVELITQWIDGLKPSKQSL